MMIKIEYFKSFIPCLPTMTIVSQSYATIKKETGVEFGRKVLLETYLYYPLIMKIKNLKCLA